MSDNKPQKKHRISDFRPQQRNANRHTPRGLGALDQSIAEGGWIGSITTAADGECFDGSARLETVYTRFGEDVEPIVIESDGTRPVILKRTDIPNADDPRAKKLAILANRVAELDLSWDGDILAELNQEIDLSGLFTDTELNDLLEGLEGSIGGEPQEENEEEVADLIDRAESGAIESRVSVGQIWSLGKHFIACCDSTKEENIRRLMKIAEVDRIDMVWADVPYGIAHTGKGISGKTQGNDFGAIEGDHDVLTAKTSFALVQEMFCDARLIFWGANYYPSVLPDSFGWLVWDKEREGDTFSGAELAFVNKGVRLDVFRHMWHGMIKASERGEKRVHPTQKPIILADWCFNKYGETLDFIFDPFWGSGVSTLAAEKMTGERTVLAFELSPAYCEVGISRFEKMFNQSAQLVGTI